MEATDPRAILRKHGLAAKKSWGQNFLVSDRVYAAIVAAAVDAEDDWVVEIGAGLGTLTARLAARVPAGRVVAVERDRDMVEVLRRELAGLPHVDIAEADAKAFDVGAVAARCGRPVVVCGNLPYQIASPILFSLLAQRAHWRRAVVMLQKEVADRLAATPGGKGCGAATAIVRAFADVRVVVRAGPGAFFPPPKVDSAVVALEPWRAPPVAIADDAAYARVVHAAFGQRRKTVRNALRAAFDDAAVDAALGAAGVDGKRRGETLTVAELAALARELG
jgi:16S rRNA (adenine1518-N6/adenine1519-N6)-dimethyltransferase